MSTTTTGPLAPAPRATEADTPEAGTAAARSCAAWDAHGSSWAVRPYAAVPGGPAEPTFAQLGLPAALAGGVTRSGLVTPFPIQTAAIPDALAGHDLLARASTGSGKTLAFGLPLIARVAALPAHPRRPRGLVLVPTRELAMQVSDTLAPLGRGIGVRFATVVGGMAMRAQIEALHRGVDVVVATPGRLLDLIRQRACDLADVEVVVLDEADQMADMGFLPDVRTLLSGCPKAVQTLLFSATLDGDVDEVVRHHMHEPVRHELEPETSPVDTMEHHLFIVNHEDKHHMFSQIAARDGRTIMFVRSQLGCERVASTVAAGGVPVLALHGGMSQAQRTRAMNDFKRGRVSVLVATDVAARGIHVDDISLVVHVDPPEDAKAYLHRAGRTARAGARGRVVTLALRHQAAAMERLHARVGVTARKARVGLLDPHVVATTGARAVHLEPARLPRRTPRV